MKCSFFQAAVVSILLYGCTTWTLTKHMEKKFDSNYTRMLQAILNKSWRQHPTQQQLYGHLPPITKTIQVRWTRHAKHNWKSWDELMWHTPVDPFTWTSKRKDDQLGPTYNSCVDTGCSLEDRLGAMDNREGGRERVKEIHTGSATWWWWWFT